MYKRPNSRLARRPNKPLGTRLHIEQLELRAMMAGDAILHWNDIALKAVADDHSGIYGSPEQGGPGAASRALAIVHTAMFDAVNSIKGQFEPYLIKVVGVKGADIDAAAGQAAHDTLVALYTEQEEYFDTALADWLALITDGKAETLGIKLGEKVAKAILKARDNDHSDQMMMYTPGTDPGDHRPDPLNENQGFLGPQWGEVTPFGVKNVATFSIDPPPALTSAEYAAAFDEVKRLGGDGVNTPTERTEEQTEIGLFWAYDGVKGLGPPPRLYNQIAQVIAEQQDNSEYENARLFALTNIAMADAGIACWDSKYVYEFWRPILGIREADTDGNAATVVDTQWTPLGAPASNQSNGGVNFTPPFPAYASGHATFGAAFFKTLELFYGRDDISFTFTSDELNGVTTDNLGIPRDLAPRTFDSFSQAAEENGQSRIYLGIHWSFDKEAGIECGNELATAIFDRVLEPMRHSMDPGFRGDILPLFRQTLLTVRRLGLLDGVRRLVDRMTSGEMFGVEGTSTASVSSNARNASSQSAATSSENREARVAAAKTVPAAADSVLETLNAVSLLRSRFRTGL